MAMGARADFHSKHQAIRTTSETRNQIPIMATKKKEEAPASTPEKEAPASTAVTETPKAELSTVSSGMSGPSSDLEIPRLNIIQKMSEIEGALGDLVLDKEDVIASVGDKMEVVVLGAHKRFKEDVPYDDDYMPQIVETEAEAKELEDNSSYGIIEFAEIVMLIPQTGEDDSPFPYTIGDTNYQLGKITVQKDAYRLTYKRLFTHMKVNGSPDSVAKVYWNFSTEPFNKGKYSWFVPTLGATKTLVPDEVKEFCARLMS